MADLDLLALRQLPPASAPRDRCPVCGEVVFWIQTRDGKRLPVNPDGWIHLRTCPVAGELRATRASRSFERTYTLTRKGGGSMIPERCPNCYRMLPEKLEGEVAGRAVCPFCREPIYPRVEDEDPDEAIAGEIATVGGILAEAEASAAATLAEAPAPPDFEAGGGDFGGGGAGDSF